MRTAIFAPTGLRTATYDPGSSPASRYFAINRRVTASSSPCGTRSETNRGSRDQACSHLQRSAASGRTIERGSVIDRTVQPLEELLPARQEVATEHALPFLERVKIQVVVLALGTLGTPQGDDVARVPFIQGALGIRDGPPLGVLEPPAEEKLFASANQRVEIAARARLPASPPRSGRPGPFSCTLSPPR